MYKIDVDSYLKRARGQLDMGTCDGLFYAAFGLRCGIESRINEYLECHKHIPKKKKKKWQLSKSDKTMLEYFGDTNRITYVHVQQSKPPYKEHIAYYTPVTPELIKIGQQFGDLLHAPKKYYPPEDAFWLQTRKKLERAYELLETSSKGTLMGPPVQKEKKVNMIFSSYSDEELKIVQQIIQKGDHIEVEIKHLKEFPKS